MRLSPILAEATSNDKIIKCHKYRKEVKLER